MLENDNKISFTENQSHSNSNSEEHVETLEGSSEAKQEDTDDNIKTI